jgi:hypothetical protein
VPEHKQEPKILIGDNIFPKQFEKEIIVCFAKRWPKLSHTIKAGESEILKKSEANPNSGRNDLR